MNLDRRRVQTGALFALAAAGLRSSLSPAFGQTRQPMLEVPQLGGLFSAAGTDGTFVLVDRQGITRAFGRDRAETRFAPASTFKIANALIALETGVTSPDEMFRWDGRERTMDGAPIADWNRDQTMRQAFKRSTVWVYQEIATRIGFERMQRFVDAFDYGNKDLSGSSIDAFWLSGRLAISASEQAAFTGKLAANELPVSRAARDAVADMMRQPAGNWTDRHVCYGKTGYTPGAPGIGWYVGYIESGNETYPFALNIDVRIPAHLAARLRIASDAARLLGFA